MADAPSWADFRRALGDARKVPLPGTFGLPDARHLLRMCREERLRFHVEVARVGRWVLENHAKKLSEDELWLVHEQTAVACLDVGQVDVAGSLIEAMMRGLPDGARLTRARAMWIELGEAQQADAAYTAVVEKFPSSLALLQRQAGKDLSRATSGAEAASALVQHLESFPADADAWNALAGIYINEQRYTQALYCLEEVLLHQPGNPRALLRYAEVNYTCGTTEAFAVAAKYFARTVQLTQGRLPRALFGLVASLSRLSDEQALSAAQKELSSLACQALCTTYPKATAEGAAVRTALARMGFNASA